MTKEQIKYALIERINQLVFFHFVSPNGFYSIKGSRVMNKILGREAVSPELILVVVADKIWYWRPSEYFGQSTWEIAFDDSNDDSNLNIDLIAEKIIAANLSKMSLLEAIAIAEMQDG